MKEAIILASQITKDFVSNRSLLVHELLDRPILNILVDQLKDAGVEKIIFLASESDGDLEKAMDLVDIDFIYQEVPATKDISFSSYDLEDDAEVLVFDSFCPFIGGELLKDFLQKTKDMEAGALRDKNSNSDLGIYYFKGSYLKDKTLESSNLNNLFDQVQTIDLDQNFLVIKTRRDFYKAQELLKTRILERLVDSGVNIIDFNSTVIGPQVQIGIDTTIYPGARILGQTKIGAFCIIEGDTSIINSTIGDDCHIKASYICDSEVHDEVTIGPFAQLRPKSIVRSGAHIGNFVELKKTDFGEGSKAGHLAYLGDSIIGKDVNISCGVITANYDGKNKHQTIVEDKAFIGSNANLIAPVKVAEAAFVAAGSTITEDVEKEALAIERTKQVNIKDWVKRKKLK
ncbi:hypothetical protein [Neofamilia massiliensis]|uniref:hypothetical protein n=1 Tax=Neofamilia massiliensis TaxID=1673724 RepID=UPI0006BB7913|nr:hypothetical protein [Neofamilia massiliensis]